MIDLVFILFYFSFIFILFGLRQRNVIVTHVTVTVTPSHNTKKNIEDSKTNNII